MLRLAAVLFASLLASQALAACPPLLNHQLKTLQGQPLDLCQYAGKPLLVVNTASKCGFAGQFEKLEGLYRQYKAQGLTVIGFPSNDFKQEYESSEKIAEFCKLTYFVEFPMVQAGSVRGDKAHPFFKQLAKASDTTPKWNFYKYLIAPDGQTVTSFNSFTEPDSPKLLDLLKPMLSAPPPVVSAPVSAAPAPVK